MAKTSDYMDYLDSEIGIAPANSQEEFQAAETIVEIMKDHDLEPTIQEFDSHPMGSLMADVLAVIMFVGVLMCGLGSAALRAVGLVLAVVPAVLLIMRHHGRDVLSEVGPAARSQNVIAVHRATGDKVTKGSRPIVVVAHYDTPRESPLFQRFAPYQVRIKSVSTPCMMFAAVMAVVQLFGFIPSGLRLVLWILGLVAMVPLLVIAVSRFVEKASPCTAGANDNKSSVAALLGLVDKVRPQDDRVSETSGRRSEDEGDSNAEGNAAAGYAESPVLGVRHGKEVLQELGILPTTCEIIYEGPSADADQSLAEANQNGESDDADAGMDVAAPEELGDASYAQEIGAGYDETTYEDSDGLDDYDAEEEAGADEGEVTDAAEDAPQSPAVDEYDDASQGEDSEYEDDTYEGLPEEEESWSEETWEDDEEAMGETSPSGSDRGRVKGFFASLKQRFSHGAKDADVEIPRGAGNDGVDYSEFEETDWGDDSWNEEPYEPQDELRAISRDELVARRATAEKSAGDENGVSYEEEPGEQGPVDDEASYETDQVSDDGYEGEPEAQPADVAMPKESEEPVEQQEPAAESRTSHDISHEDGPDWSVLEEEEVVTEAPVTATDPTVYQQPEDDSDDDLDIGAAELVEIEDELDEDQVASATIRPRPTTPKPEPSDAGKEAAAEDGSVPESGATAEDEGEADGLSWEEVDNQGDAEEDDVLPKDSRGLDTISDDYDAYQDDVEDDDLEEPDPIDDPTWGETSYVPPRPKSNVARRATLYDVPSPSEDTVDPLADDGSNGADSADEETHETNGHVASGESDSARARKWKGGAAIRSDLVGGDQQEEDDAPGDDDTYAYDQAADDLNDSQMGEEELGTEEVGESGQADIDQGDVQDAILKMGDDLLVSHDIWFVAAGASSVGQAGIKAFLSDFRQDIRGAFLINLDSVGAGELTVLTSEGADEGRRADRRLVRLISGVADDLHLPLVKRSHSWGDTDATPAMRSRVRAVTIMGMDQNGLPALSHTADDVPENVDPQQVASVVRMVAEAIRRS